MADQSRSSGEGKSPADPETRFVEPDLDHEHIRNALAFVNHVRMDLGDHTPDTNAMLTAEIHAPNHGSADESSERIPTKIGRFKVEKRIGQGGFAIVYLARDPNLDRLVALKVLRQSQLLSNDSKARFGREARATATLSHPNIVPVFETGAVDDVRFIVAAYCPSISLRQWFDKQTQSTEPVFAAKIISLLAEATEHAHQRGVIHRDLKPANILIECVDANAIESRSEFDTALLHITDFGLASYSTFADQLETSEGAIVGTPAYMSPEQARGESRATFATDIYSLGVMLYELLTDQLPILGETHIETLLAIGSKDPTPPRKINKAIPRDLEAICLKCLSKAPADRYASAIELCADLNRWLKGQPVEARRITSSARLAKWCSRNRFLTAAFCGISIALCVAIFQWRGATYQSNRANRHRMMAQDVIDEMVSNVASNPNLPPEMRKSITQRAVDLQIKLMEEEPENHDIRRQTLRAFDRLIVLLVELYEHEHALNVTDQALQIVEPVCHVSDFAETKMDLVRHRVNLLRYLGEIDVAEKELVQATEVNPQTRIGQARNSFEAGMLKLGQREFENARIEFSNALKQYELIEDQTHLRLEIARSHFFFGFAELKLGNLDLAKTRMTDAEAIYADLHRLKSSSETILEDFGKTHMYLGQIAKRQLSGIEKPTTTSDDLRLLEASRKNFVEAERLFQEVLDLNPLRLTDYGLLAMTFEYHVDLEVEHGDRENAEQVLVKFTTLFQSVPDNVRERQTIGRILAEARLKLAKMLIEKGEYDRAKKQLNACKDFVGTLLDEFPGVERLESIADECEEKLEEIGKTDLECVCIRHDIRT